MLNDFKAFIARGNILDLAIAVIMGAAFGAIVKTFTGGIIMPVIGSLTGGIDFKDKVINLGKMPVSTPAEIAAATAAKEPMIMYGQFINPLSYLFLPSDTECYLLKVSKYFNTLYHSVKTGNRYIFRYR